MGGNENFSANSQNIKKFQLQQKARSLVIILVIAIPVFIAMVAYLMYQDATKQNATNSSLDQTAPAITLPDTQNSSGTPDPNLQAGSGTAVTTPGGTTTPSPSDTISTTLPAGVATALNSIEANGIKGNPYVSSNLDTSSVPSGTSILFDRASWSSYSQGVGTINAKITILGDLKTGSVTFSDSDGTWKATGYSLN